MSYVESFMQYIKKADLGKVVKSFLPYLIAVLSGVTTYFLYSYFNRDIVRVQSVSVRPKEIVLTIDRPFANKLSRLLGERSIDRIQNRLDLTQINKEYIIEFIKSLRDKSSDIDEKLRQLASLKNQINDLKDDSLNKEALEKTGSLGDQDYYDFDDDLSFSQRYISDKRKKSKQEIIADINKNLQRDSKLKADIDDIVGQLAQKSKQAIDDNRDKFIVEIIAFNEGNQQTVIRNKGILGLGQNQINLKRASFVKIEDYYTKLSKAISGKYNQDGTNSNYLIIEPKSFIVMSLEVDDFNNKNRDIEVIKREYLSGQSFVGLTLFDIKNSPIEQYNFLLQNDIEVDPNEELSKYTTQYVSK